MATQQVARHAEQVGAQLTLGGVEAVVVDEVHEHLLGDVGSHPIDAAIETRESIHPLLVALIQRAEGLAVAALHAL